MQKPKIGSHWMHKKPVTNIKLFKLVIGKKH